ncbi:MAG: M56 family metallopeptidase [Planctomycetota bacterium]
MSSGQVRWVLEAAMGGYARGALILALALLLARLARRRSPAERHRVLALGLWLALLVPFLPRLPLAVLPVGATAEAATTTQAFGLTLLAVAALGTALLSARRLRSALALLRFERETRPVAEPLWRARNAAQARAAGRRRAPELLVHEQAQGPATWGFRRARIVLPTEALNWPVARRRAVLLHELAHVRRRDVLVQLGAEGARALHWLDPLAWIALRELQVERERACDDAVLQAGARPSGYAAFLLAFARRLAHSQRALAAQALALFGRGPVRPELDARLEHLLDPEQPMQQRHPRAGLPAALLGLLALPIATLELVSASPASVASAPVASLPPAAAATAPLGDDDEEEEEPVLEVHDLVVHKQGDEYQDLPSDAALRALCPTLSQAWLRDVLRAAEQAPSGLPSAGDLAGIPGVDGAKLADRIEDEVERLLAELAREQPAAIHWQVLRLDANSARSPAPPRAPAAKPGQAAKPAPTKLPPPKTVAPAPVPRAEPAAEPAPSAPARRELALPRVELVARTRLNSTGPDGLAHWTPGANYSFLYETSSVEAVLGNFDVEFSNWNGTPALRVGLCTDDRSTLAELGALDITKLVASKKRLQNFPSSADWQVPLRLGHAYLIHTQDTNLDHWTAVKVLALSGERVTLAYRVLLDDSHPEPGFPRPPRKKRR